MTVLIARAVYGTIMVGSLTAVESSQQESYAGAIVSVTVAMLVLWIAHAYSSFAGERLHRSEALTLSGLYRAMAHEASLLAGAVLPMLVLIVCAAAGVALGDALAAATWVAAGLIVVVEIGAGIRAHLTGRQLLLQVTLGALMGAAVVSVHTLAHH
jgi:hypothetical protein